MSISSDDFKHLTEDFQEVTPQEAKRLIEEREGHILFIGRATCSYCRLFVPKLHNVMQRNNLNVFWINSEHPDYMDSLQELRSKYGVATVPSLIYSDKHEIKVHNDSSLSEMEIENILNV